MMKTTRILLLILFVGFFATNGQAKSPGYKMLDTYKGDTLDYLVENFLYRTEYYNKMALSELINDLELPIIRMFAATDRYTTAIIGIFLCFNNTRLGPCIRIDVYDFILPDIMSDAYRNKDINLLNWKKIKNITIPEADYNNNYLEALGLPSSGYYNQQLYDEFIADEHTCLYREYRLAESTCNTLSSHYDNNKCDKVCDLNSIDYNCYYCNDFTLNNSTVLYDDTYSTIIDLLKRGNKTEALDYFLWMEGGYTEIDYTITSDPNYDGFIKVDGGTYTSVNFTIGKELSTTSIVHESDYDLIIMHYFGTLLREMYRAADKGRFIYYNYDDRYGETIVNYLGMARCLVSANGILPQGSPFWIKKTYKESLNYYNTFIKGTDKESSAEYYYNQIETYISGISNQLNNVDFKCY